jgi:hypothetical protein
MWTFLKDTANVRGVPPPRLNISFDNIYYYVLSYDAKQTEGSYLTRTQIEALFMINSIDYINDPSILSSNEEKNPLIYAFEGAGNYSVTGWGDYHPDGRYGAMVTVVQNGRITFMTRDASTLPDRYDVKQGAEAQFKYPCTIDAGVYSVSSGNHGNYPALHVSGNGAVPGIRYGEDGFAKTNGDGTTYANSNYHGTEIHIHTGWGGVSTDRPYSTGCILVTRDGWAGDAWADFANSIGISNQINGMLIVDRSLDTAERYYK